MCISHTGPLTELYAQLLLHFSLCVVNSVCPLQVDALRLRLEEKESFLNKKTKQLQDLTEEKGTLAGEIRDMKDMLEVKERKINVLQKKVRKHHLQDSGGRGGCSVS